MVKVYDMTSGTLRQEIEGNDFLMTQALPEKDQAMIDIAPQLALQEVEFERVESSTSVLAGLDIKQLLDMMD